MQVSTLNPLQIWSPQVRQAKSSTGVIRLNLFSKSVWLTYFLFNKFFDKLKLGCTCSPRWRSNKTKTLFWGELGFVAWTFETSPSPHNCSAPRFNYSVASPELLRCFRYKCCQLNKWECINWAVWLYLTSSSFPVALIEVACSRPINNTCLVIAVTTEVSDHDKKRQPCVLCVQLQMQHRLGMS